MSEFIVETILPGTYIEVRSEGLLTIGAIPTGNVGIIGTAEMGGGQVEIISSFEEGRTRFGESGNWETNANNNLNLVRGLRLLFDNGAQTVYAQRAFDETEKATAAKAATYQVLNESDAPVLTLRARTRGAGGNRLQIRIEDSEAQAEVVDEIIKGNGSLLVSAQGIVIPKTNGSAGITEPSIGKVSVMEQGLLKRYQLKSAPVQVSENVVQFNPDNRTLSFLVQPSSAAEVRASYWVPKQMLRKVTLQYGNIQEAYIVPSISYLAQRLRENPSKLVEVETVSGNGLPKKTARPEVFSGGKNGEVTTDHIQDALDKLIEQNVQIVVVMGFDFSSIKAPVLGHLERTENIGRERIAVVGADSKDVAKIQENANEVADKRLILVAPGLKQKINGKVVELPPFFAAAAVAGKLSSLSPHISLTNKTLAGIESLAAEYNYGELKSLVQDRVLVLQKKRGFRVVKGITTHDEAFKQITLRRIVDYVKEGTRLGANQYIGRLNNKRVRENLRTTLDSFLADLLVREFLTGYKLTVFADRAMEIRGEVQVIMDLNPTFSIDVIRVIMNLS
jgi:hypothetical protein